MSPLEKLAEMRRSWRSHTRESIERYTTIMTQVEALRVEVCALEAEIRRTERSNLPEGHKSARIRGLASRAAESYGYMLSLMRQAADVYPAIVTERLEIPHTFTRRERERFVYLPERPPSLRRREVGGLLAIGIVLALAAMLLSELLPALTHLPPQ
jgi:hypothetical protein